MKTLNCITKLPFISVIGHGRFQAGDVGVFPDDVADCLLLTDNWESDEIEAKVTSKVRNVGYNKVTDTTVKHFKRGAK